MTDLYDHSHVAISRLLGRTFNNPLGTTVFPLLRRLTASHPAILVLDAGCGRGQTAIWWAAHTKAMVDAFDPAEAMLDEARTNTGAAGVANRIRFFRSDISHYRSERSYGLVLAQDVLCYSVDRPRDLEHLGRLLGPGGVLCVSDYYLEGDSPDVRGVIDAWGIAVPGSFHAQGEPPAEVGLERLFHFDTTRQYREHWTGMRSTLSTRFDEATRTIGQAQAEAFMARIEAILKAVATGRFGHCLTLLARPAG